MIKYTPDKSNTEQNPPQKTCADTIPAPPGMYSCKDAVDTRPQKKAEEPFFPVRQNWPKYIQISLEYNPNLCNIQEIGSSLSTQERPEIKQGKFYLKVFDSKLSIGVKETYSVIVSCYTPALSSQEYIKTSVEVRPVRVKNQETGIIEDVPHNILMKIYHRNTYPNDIEWKVYYNSREDRLEENIPFKTPYALKVELVRFTK